MKHLQVVGRLSSRIKETYEKCRVLVEKGIGVTKTNLPQECLEYQLGRHGDASCSGLLQSSESVHLATVENEVYARRIYALHGRLLE
jgi:hypothetical protein